jgi:methylamine dehydrogenase accessory protein MauD
MTSVREVLAMNLWWLASYLVLWLLVLFLGFLLLGALRALGLLRWRLEQLEATTPSRTGRGGLRPGKRAPDFTLPCVTGGEVSLRDFAGRRLLLVFTQSGCKPCHKVAPELNRLHEAGEVQVLVVNNGEAKATQEWAGEVKARFPVLRQQQFSVSKRYEMYATPFAFLIDERGVIVSRGIVNNGQHLGFVLSGAGEAAKNGQTEAEPAAAEAGVA